MPYCRAFVPAVAFHPDCLALAQASVSNQTTVVSYSDNTTSADLEVRLTVEDEEDIEELGAEQGHAK